MNILVIRDNKPGHYNQTEGLLCGLNKIYPDATVQYCSVEIKGKFSRKILKLLLNIMSSFFQNKQSLNYLDRFYKTYQLPQNRPDIIISTGGNTAGINAWLAQAYHAKNILNGALRGLKEELFTAVTTVIDLGYSNQIILDAAPNTMIAQSLKEKAKDFASEHHLDTSKKYYSLLLGGDGAGYRYNESYYDALIKLVKEMAAKQKIRWLITTSRRTPINIEKKMRRTLTEESAYFVSYHHKEEKVLLPFLGLSEAVFVTEESSSMISEAVSARKPVYTLGISSAKPDENYQNILQKFVLQKRIQRTETDRLEHFEIKSDDFMTLQEDSCEEVAMKIKPFLDKD
jgi:mitochondrial fission protein ELM1